MALGAFGLGALGSGRLGSAIGRRRGTLLSAAAALQAIFLAVGVVMAALAASPVQAGYRYGLIVALGVSYLDRLMTLTFHAGCTSAQLATCLPG